jgi:hypothetical protein
MLLSNVQVSTTIFHCAVHALLGCRKHGELQRRALYSNDIQADRFARAVHKRITLATHTELETPGMIFCRSCYASTIVFLVNICCRTVF